MPTRKKRLSIDPAQARMARAALRLSMQELARQARVSDATIKRIERDRVSIYGKTSAALSRFYASAGVTFIEDDGSGPGVRFKPR